MKIRLVLFFWNPFLVFLVISSGANECQDALGIESGMIRDNQISASSQKGMEKAYEARLNGDKAWKPEDFDTYPWLQVDFVQLVNVTAVATQGRPGRDEYVKTYKVGYSLDRLSWHNITDESREDKIFTGNVDGDSIVLQMFMKPVTCLYIRIYPVTWMNRCALRLEWYGCNANECEGALGIETGSIRDDQFLASSQKGMEQAHEARLYGDKAWKPDDGDNSPWIQINFEQLLKVTAVATQGRPGRNEYVRTYKVSYSSDGSTWHYIMDNNGEDQIFDGNVDGDTIVFQTFMQSITCMYIRISPVTWTGSCALRFELYGCNGWLTTTSAAMTVFGADPSDENTSTNTTSTSFSYTSTSADTELTSRTVMDDVKKGLVPGIVAGSVIGVLILLMVLLAIIRLPKRGKRERASNSPAIEYDSPYEVPIEAKQETIKPINNAAVYKRVSGTSQTSRNSYKDTGEVYHEEQDIYEYPRAHMGGKDSTEEQNEGLVDIYAKSEYGGRPSIELKKNNKDICAIYHDVDDIEDVTNEHGYTYPDVTIKLPDSNS